MKNEFLKAFYSLSGEEANRQLEMFFETLKFTINGIELTKKGTQDVADAFKKLQEENLELKKTQKEV